jgi:rod shape-determining protein MreD
MAGTATGRILQFILLLALQITLFDRIHLFGCATPLFYIYFIIKLPGNTNRNILLLLSALLGLSIDLFHHTLGINMLACVVIGFGRHSLLDWFVPHDMFENYLPSVRSLGVSVFYRYVLAMTLLHHIILFSTESLSWFDPLSLLFSIAGSAVLTMALIFASETIYFGRTRK